MWTGNPTSVPDGWTLCDGTNPEGDSSAVPDLRNQFVVGAGDEHDVGDSGGNKSAEIDTDTDDAGGHSHDINEDTAGTHTHEGGTDYAGEHNHGGSTGDHQLTEDEMPSHTHGYRKPNENAGKGRYTHGANPNQGSADATTEPTGGDQSHDHSISDDGSHDHGMDLDEAGGHDHDVSADEVSGHNHRVEATVNTEPPFYALAYIIRIS